MDCILDNNMVDGLFFCTVLTGRRGGHTPSAQAGAETRGTSAEAVKLDPCCFRKGYFERVGTGVGDEVCRVVRPLHLPLVIRAAHTLLSDKLMNCCAAGTNGCFDFRC